MVQRRAIELGDLPSVLVKPFKRVRFCEAAATLVLPNEDRAARAMLDPPVAGREIPVLHLKYRDARMRMQKDEVGPKSVQVRLKIDFPLGCEVFVEELEDKSLARLKWCSKAVELVDPR